MHIPCIGLTFDNNSRHSLGCIRSGALEMLGCLIPPGLQSAVFSGPEVAVVSALSMNCKPIPLANFMRLCDINNDNPIHVLLKGLPEIFLAVGQVIRPSGTSLLWLWNERGAKGFYHAMRRSSHIGGCQLCLPRPDSQRIALAFQTSLWNSCLLPFHRQIAPSALAVAIWT